MKTIKRIFIGTMLALISVRTVLAEGIGCGGGLGVIGEFFCARRTTVEVGNKLNTALSGIVGFLTIIAALWFLIQFIIAGFNWINAGVDKGRAQEAREKITNAVVGLLVVVSAWVIVAIIGSLVGLEILNPGSILDKIGIV